MIDTKPGNHSDGGTGMLPKEKSSLQKAVFKIDHWIGLRMGLLRLLDFGMPPKRNSDTDFNENYLSDRRWVTQYAGRIAEIRLLIFKLARITHCPFDFAGKLDFDPLHNLRRTSPLDHYRDRLFEAYRELTRQLSPDNLSAVERCIENNRSALMGKSGSTDLLPGQFLSVLDEGLSGRGALGLVVEQILEQKAVSLQHIHPELYRRQRERLAASLSRLTGKDRLMSPDLNRLRLDVLELADQLGKEEPLLPDKIRKDAAPHPQSAWLRLYCALILLDVGEGDYL